MRTRGAEGAEKPPGGRRFEMTEGTTPGNIPSGRTFPPTHVTNPHQGIGLQPTAEAPKTRSGGTLEGDVLIAT